jgi:zinc/manganese transport system substrate-binding protein
MRIILILLALSAAGCGSARSGGNPTVVAAENVYGDIAAQIGGSRVAVTSILTDPNADPHLYEPGTASGLDVARARVVIQNGLGYDAFVAKLEDAAPSSKRVTVTVADALGVRGGDANPHLWYDVPRLRDIAAAIERALERALPRDAAAFRAGLSRFDARLAPLDAEVAAIRAAHGGERVAYTESVPGYLLAAAGLRNVAPNAFTQAIEDGSEPPPSAVADMLDLMRSGKARVLLYNTQAVSPITSRIREAAASAGIPVVGVSETLPPGLRFQAWQLRQARALEAALDG